LYPAFQLKILFLFFRNRRKASHNGPINSKLYITSFMKLWCLYTAV